mmetsp:Transcript_17675/g.46121  ORF Transcript_17675/g.46121 Transcript_17675/m.46121 type:complete len:212 (-) Transcript_17675:514-1149(-)
MDIVVVDALPAQVTSIAATNYPQRVVHYMNRRAVASQRRVSAFDVIPYHLITRKVITVVTFLLRLKALPGSGVYDGDFTNGLVPVHATIDEDLVAVGPDGGGTVVGCRVHVRASGRLDALPSAPDDWGPHGTVRALVQGEVQDMAPVDAVHVSAKQHPSILEQPISGQFSEAVAVRGCHLVNLDCYLDPGVLLAVAMPSVQCKSIDGKDSG